MAYDPLRSSGLVVMRSEHPDQLSLWAVSYADQLGWPVLPGLADEVMAPERRPSRDVKTIVAWWTQTPEASILTPAGEFFDAVSVPESVGREAISRIGAVRNGWAGIAQHGRVTFLLKQGLAYGLKLRLSHRMDERVVRTHQAGELIALPPSPGASWVNEDGPFSSLTVDPLGLIPALASAAARHADPQWSAANGTPVTDCRTGCSPLDGASGDVPPYAAVGLVLHDQ